MGFISSRFFQIFFGLNLLLSGFSFAVPEISSQELVRELLDQKKLGDLRDEMEKSLKGLVKDERQFQPMINELNLIFTRLASNQTGRDELLSRLAAFPTLKLNLFRPTHGQAGLGQLSGLFAGNKKTQDETPYRGEQLRELLIPVDGDCPNVGWEPTELNHEKLPGLRRGHLMNESKNGGSMSACEIFQSVKLADIMTSLSLGKGYFVKDDEECIETPEDLVRVLLRNGHEIVVENERMAADFLALVYKKDDKDVAVRWPVWLDTGVVVGGRPLIVPMGHSHFVWTIRPSDDRGFLSSRIMFYLGVTGVAFYPDVTMNPDWTGANSLYSVSAQDVDSVKGQFVIASIENSGLLLGRTRREQIKYKDEPGFGAPFFGYGLLGVCNDSQVTVHRAINDPVLTGIPNDHFPGFPLIRSKKYISDDSNEPLQDIIKSNPNDTYLDPEMSVNPRRPSENELLTSIYQMSHGLWKGSSPRDVVYNQQLKLIRQKVGISSR